MNFAILNKEYFNAMELLTPLLNLTSVASYGLSRNCLTLAGMCSVTLDKLSNFSVLQVMFLSKGDGSGAYLIELMKLLPGHLVLSTR